MARARRKKAAFTRRLTFLQRAHQLIREKLDAMHPSGVGIMPDDFDQIVRTARAHAGGLSRAASLRQAPAQAAEAEPDADLDDEAYTVGQSVLFALYLEPLAAEKLAIAGGERPEDLHLTLCYLGEISAYDDVQLARMLLIAAQIARQYPAPTGVVSGWGRFAADPGDPEDEDIFFATADVPLVTELSYTLVQALRQAGLCASEALEEAHAYTPHITLQYLAASAPNPVDRVPPVPLRFAALSFVAGSHRSDLPFLGRNGEEPDLMSDLKLETGSIQLAETRKEGPERLPADAYAYVPDPEMPSTWKLRIDDARHVGAAIAALGPGYRGNRVEIPAAALGRVKARIRAAWRKLHPDLPEEEMPEAIRAHEIYAWVAPPSPLRLFQEVEAYAEPPEWIPFLPKPGVYRHPSYGEVHIDSAFTDRVIRGFRDRVYQEKLPIDAEHQLQLSGAVGWISDLRQNADGSVDARAEWTPRGRKLIQGDGFRYISPAWYRQWEQPETGKIYQDVAIGAALTTRPFFKERALRPMVAAETGVFVVEDTEDSVMAATPTSVDASVQSFAEMQGRLRVMSEQLQATEAALAEVRQLAENERAARMSLEQQARRRRFTEEVLGKSEANNLRWFGEVEKNVSVLEMLATQIGEDSEGFRQYVESQRATARALRSSAEFKEIGSASSAVESPLDPAERARALAKVHMEADPKLTQADALAQVFREHPDLYEEYASSIRDQRRGR